MITHTLIQGTPEWSAHRDNHFNASDAPAMMGSSAYETRSQLIHRLHTGITATIDAGLQRRFDEGHRFEALARPLAEKIIGEDLYPIVGTMDEYSASFDGLTADDSIAFEHKTMNAALYGDGAPWGDSFSIPMQYRIQMEQQCMISGCDKVLFMASRWNGDVLDVMQHCWYRAEPGLRTAIGQGWIQLKKDLAKYVPPVAAPVLVAAAQSTLPAVSVKLDGAIAIIDNLGVFGIALTAYIDKINKSPQTDQDFVDLKAVVTTLEKAEAALDAAENTALASISSVNAMQSAVSTLRALTKQNRLLCEKIYKAENDRRKLEIVQGGSYAFAKHITGLNERLGKPYMPTIIVNFAGVAKNLRTLASLQNAVDTELARLKIEASATADKIQTNLGLLTEAVGDHAFLFNDTAQIIIKENDDFKVLVESRIAAYEVGKARAIAQERERIRAEEQAKAETKVLAELAALERGKADEAAKVVMAQAAQDAAIAAEEEEKQRARIKSIGKADAEMIAAMKSEIPVRQPMLPATRPTDDQIIEVLSIHFRVDEGKVFEWLLDMDLSTVD